MPPEVLSRSPSTSSTLSCITVVQGSGDPASEGPASTPPTSVTDGGSSEPSGSAAKDNMATKGNGRVRRVTNVSTYNENVLSANTRGVRTVARPDSQSPSKGKSVLGKRARDSSGAGGARRAGSKKRRVSRRLIEVEKQKDRASTESPKKQTRQAVAEATLPAEAEIKPMPKKPKATARSKKYLAQGLYVGQDPDYDPRLTEEKNKKKLAASGKAPVKHRSILPDPMLAGKRLLELGRGFRLPFNIFSPLPPGQPRPDEYRKTQKNVFVGDAADFWRFTKKMEHSTCLCEPSNGCDEDCLNRYMFYECDSNNCNVGPMHCTNRAFDHLRARVKAGGKFNVGVDVIKTADRGYGVRSNRCFEPNQIIMEYTGEIITQDECDFRMRNEYKENECFYLMMFDQNMIIDATRGSIARFVNHSCEPNCRMEKWTVAGKPRMALFAGDDGIVTGEELTYDYNFDPFSSKNIQECRCGSAGCRGVLGPRSKEKDGKAAPAGDLSTSASVKGKAAKGGAGTKRKLSAAAGARGAAATAPSSPKKRKLATPKSPQAKRRPSLPAVGTVVVVKTSATKSRQKPKMTTKTNPKAKSAAAASAVAVKNQRKRAAPIAPKNRKTTVVTVRTTTTPNKAKAASKAKAPAPAKAPAKTAAKAPGRPKASMTKALVPAKTGTSWLDSGATKKALGTAVAKAPLDASTAAIAATTNATAADKSDKAAVAAIRIQVQVKGRPQPQQPHPQKKMKTKQTTLAFAKAADARSDASVGTSIVVAPKTAAVRV